MVLMYRWDAGRGAEADRARALHRRRRRAGDGPRADHPSRLRQVRPFQPAGGRRWRRPAAAGPRGQDRRAVATARPNTGYGMTETCGIITSFAGDFFVDKPRAAAAPCRPSRSSRRRRRRALAAGQLRRALGQGRPVIKGYINRPEATAESITDGWLHTGDWPTRRRRLHLHRRPQEGHGPARRREHLLRRGRGRAPPASGGRRMCRLRRARPAAGRRGRRRRGAPFRRHPGPRRACANTARR